MDDSVFVEDVCVCIILFLRMLEFLKNFSIVMEIIVVGMEDVKVIFIFSFR